MTYKQKAIKACEKLAHKYRNPTNEIFFKTSHCPLCDIYFTKNQDCIGCPLNDELMYLFGCDQFNTYKKAEMNQYSSRKKESFENRAKLFDKIIPILKKIPAKRFTPSGWTYFKELNRKW